MRMIRSPKPIGFSAPLASRARASGLVAAAALCSLATARFARAQAPSPAAASAAQAAAPSAPAASTRIRDGRQIYLALTDAVGLRSQARASFRRPGTAYSAELGWLQLVEPTYRATLSGLPERGSVGEMAAGLASILRLIAGVCDLYALRATAKDYFGDALTSGPDDREARMPGDRWLSDLRTRIQSDARLPARYGPAQLEKVAKLAAERSYRLVLRRSPTPAEESSVLAALNAEGGRAQAVLEAHALSCAQAAASFDFLEVPARVRRTAGRPR